jgi:adenylate cyclase
MEPLFLAVICGCNAGLFRDALHEVYLPRIQREDAHFAANVLGARGALLLVLIHFFEQGRWGSPVQTGTEEQTLTGEDQLFILIQAAVYLTATQESASEARLCYERAEALCHSLDRPLDLYLALMGQWRYFLMTEKLSVAFQIAKRVHALAEKQPEARIMIGAYNTMSNTSFWMGDFEAARQNQKRVVTILRSGHVWSQFEEVDSQAVACLCHEGLFRWHFGKASASRAPIAEAISMAKDLSDMHGLALALFFAAMLGYFERKSSEVERLASELIELSTRQYFRHWLALGSAYRGWARSASGNPAEGISWIENGIRDYRAIGSTLFMPLCLVLKADTLHLADRTSEALEVINEAEAMAERFEQRYYCAELHRLRGVFLAAMGAEETQIEAAFQAAISVAREQKSISLAKRAEATYAEYRRQKASGLGGRGFRLPL